MTVDTSRSPTGQDADLAVVLRYFAIADGREQGDLLALFADDAEVYFPKYGVGRGAAALGEIGGGLGQFVKRMEHQVEAFGVIRSGSKIVIEGTSRGETADGGRWEGGKTVGGRFCSVFDVRDGRIHRMYVYLDPDYTQRRRRALPVGGSVVSAPAPHRDGAQTGRTPEAFAVAGRLIRAIEDNDVDALREVLRAGHRHVAQHRTGVADR